MEREIKKWVPLKIDLLGPLPPNSRVTLKPDRAFIRGPHSVLKRTGLLKTVPIETEDIEANPRQKISLQEVDPRITLENFSDELEVNYTPPSP